MSEHKHDCICVECEDNRREAKRYRKLKDAFERQYNVNIDDLYENLLNNFDNTVDLLPDVSAESETPQQDQCDREPLPEVIGRTFKGRITSWTVVKRHPLEDEPQSTPAEEMDRTADSSRPIK